MLYTAQAVNYLLLSRKLDKGLRKLNETINCPLCGGEVTTTLLVHSELDKIEKSLNFSKKNWAREWRKCNSCFSAINIMKSNLEAKLDSIASDYYEIDLKQSLKSKFSAIINLPPEKSDNCQRVYRIKNFLTSAFDPNIKLDILDIGSGLGVFPFKFIELNGEMVSSFHVVEPDPNAASHLRKIPDIKLKEGFFDPRNYKPIFHLATLNKVIEHIKRPQKLLNEIRSVLIPQKSLLYVEVPHIQTIFSRSPDDNILGSMHKHLYTVSSLTMLLNNCEYEVLNSGFVSEPSGKLTCFAFATPDLRFWT